MASPDLDNRSWEYCNMSLEELLDRYDIEGKNDPLIHEFAAGEVRQFKNTPYYYMVVETYSLPGIRISHIWDSREDD